MPKTHVHCLSQLAADPDTVWAALSGFDLSWHPGVAHCTLDRTPNGTLVRRFTDLNGGRFIEERTYISDTDRVLCYRLTSGIEGIVSYHARVEVTADAGGTSITWHADIDAASTRVEAIADGTRAIFEAAFEALGDLPSVAPQALPLPKGGGEPERIMMGSMPQLSALSVNAARAKGQTLVLFLHGIGGQALNWTAQLEALGGHFPVAALDLRGYGQSALGHRATQIDDHCDDILHVAEQFKAKQIVVVGLSFGSWIATSFAMRHPEKLAGLVLLGGCTGMSEADAHQREAFRMSRTKPLDEGQRPADFAPAVVEALAGPEATPAQRDALLQSMASIPSATYRDALNCFCNPCEQFDFGRITCPVLLMTGAHDRLAPPEEIRHISERMLDAIRDHGRDVQFEVIEAAGHVCNIEAPDAVTARLNGFLARMPGMPSTQPATRDERKRRKHARILAAAHKEFCAAGFDGASMDRLAKAADVSKPTLYSYFGDKEGLFAAVLDVGRSHLVAPLTTGEGTLVDRLWQFSWTYARFVLRPDMLSLARLILGEAGRRPESAEAYHAAGPGKAFAGIVTFIEDCVARGELQVDTPTLAANDLWSLILSGPRDHYLHHIRERPTDADLLRAIGHGLKVFLTVYSTDQARDLHALEQKLAQDLSGR